MTIANKYHSVVVPGKTAYMLVIFIIILLIKSYVSLKFESPWVYRDEMIYAEMAENIFKIQLKALRNSLTRLGIGLEISDEAVKNLALNGFSSKYGARQISGVIRSQLARPISKKIVREEVKNGQNIQVEWNADENDLNWKIQ